MLVLNQLLLLILIGFIFLFDRNILIVALFWLLIQTFKTKEYEDIPKQIMFNGRSSFY
jgi:hypothetical protein